VVVGEDHLAGLVRTDVRERQGELARGDLDGLQEIRGAVGGEAGVDRHPGLDLDELGGELVESARTEVLEHRPEDQPFAVLPDAVAVAVGHVLDVQADHLHLRRQHVEARQARPRPAAVGRGDAQLEDGPVVHAGEGADAQPGGHGRAPGRDRADGGRRREHHEFGILRGDRDGDVAGAQAGGLSHDQLEERRLAGLEDAVAVVGVVLHGHGLHADVAVTLGDGHRHRGPREVHPGDGELGLARGARDHRQLHRAGEVGHAPGVGLVALAQADVGTDDRRAARRDGHGGRLLADHEGPRAIDLRLRRHPGPDADARIADHRGVQLRPAVDGVAMRIGDVLQARGVQGVRGPLDVLAGEVLVERRLVAVGIRGEGLARRPHRDHRAAVGILHEALHEAALVVGAGRAVDGEQQEVVRVGQRAGVAHGEVRVRHRHVEEVAVAELVDLAEVAGVQRVDERLAGQRRVPREELVGLVHPHVLESRAGLDHALDEVVRILRAVQRDGRARVPRRREQHLRGIEQAAGPPRAHRRALELDDLVDDRRHARGIPHGQASDGDVRTEVGVVAGVVRVDERLAQPAVAVGAPVAVEAREVHVGRDIGVPAEGIERAADEPRGDDVGVAADQQVLQPPLGIGLLQEHPQGLLEVDPAPVVGLDPLARDDLRRQPHGRAVVGEARELARQGLRGDDQVADRRALEARQRGRQVRRAGLVQEHAVGARVAAHGAGIGDHAGEHRLGAGALARHAALALEHRRGRGGGVRDPDLVAGDQLEPLVASAGPHDPQRMHRDRQEPVAAPGVQATELAPCRGEHAVRAGDRPVVQFLAGARLQGSGQRQPAGSLHLGHGAGDDLDVGDREVRRHEQQEVDGGQRGLAGGPERAAIRQHRDDASGRGRAPGQVVGRELSGVDDAGGRGPDRRRGENQSDQRRGEHGREQTSGHAAASWVASHPHAAGGRDADAPNLT